MVKNESPEPEILGRSVCSVASLTIPTIGSVPSCSRR